jgi:predicted nuclease of predicted toxin-antitoxin system
MGRKPHASASYQFRPTGSREAQTDENIGRRGLKLLKASGHDVMTVWDQGLHGVTDEELFEVCATEGRALITLDRDFGQVTRFP